MSAFDDEFGLFGDEADETERRSTLGARRIATNETIIDDIEPEDDAPGRRGEGGRRGAGGKRRPPQQHRAPADPAASQQRASELLEFLAKKLVAKPDAVSVESFPAEDGEQPLIELAVDPDDIGKVIGRSGRVAQALRTIVRATAEGRVSVEILDNDELYEDDEEVEDDGAGDEGEDDRETSDDDAE